MSLDILEQHQRNISFQAIDKKLGSSCESFLKELFEKLLSGVLKGDNQHRVGDIKKFMIKDSTKIIVSANGFGGKVISVGVQTQIDLLHGTMEIGLREGSKNDQGECIQDWQSLESNCLYVRDLGYISATYMQRIEQAGSYYLNRLPVKTILYEKGKRGFRKVSTREIKRRVNKAGIVDAIFYAGKEKYPVRTLIEAVPDSVRDKRIKKSTAFNKTHGYQTSKQYIERSGLNIWVTNLPKVRYDTLLVKNLYRMRWQIELIFKTWKSILGMQHIGGCRTARVMCQLYAKLILALIHWTCCKLLRPVGTISFYKVAKIMMRTKDLLRQLLFSNKSDWLTLWTTLSERALKVEIRKDRLRTQTVIDVFLS
jgi:hypothetical protein